MKLFLAGLVIPTLSCAAQVAYIPYKTPSTGHVTSEKSFDVKIGGKFLFDYCTGKNKEIKTYKFTGKFLKDLFLIPGEGFPTYLQHEMFSVNRSRLTVDVERFVGSFKYSFDLVLTGDASSTRSVREIYGKVEHPELGVFVFGDTKGVEDRMIGGPSNILMGSGGTDGNFLNFVNVTTGCRMEPGSPVGDTKEATKVCYLTPRKGGFQGGISYAPNTNHLGGMPLNAAFSPSQKPFQTFDLNSMAVGLSYLGQLQRGLTLNLSCVHLSGRTRPERPDRELLLRNNTQSLDCGLVIGLGPWSVAAEYIWNGKSGRLINDLTKISPKIDGSPIEVKNYIARAAGKHWSLNTGIAYSTKDAGISFSYFYTQKNTGIIPLVGGRSSRAIGRAFALSTELRLAPGFSPYLEGAIYRMTNPDWAYIASAIASLTDWEYNAVPSNTSRMILAGIKVQF